jgi:hypothetical protein
MRSIYVLLLVAGFCFYKPFNSICYNPLSPTTHLILTVYLAKVFYLARHMQIGDAQMQEFAEAICAVTGSESLALGASHTGLAPVFATFSSVPGTWALGGGIPAEDSSESEAELSTVGSTMTPDSGDELLSSGS